MLKKSLLAVSFIMFGCYTSSDDMPFYQVDGGNADAREERVPSERGDRLEDRLLVTAEWTSTQTLNSVDEWCHASGTHYVIFNTEVDPPINLTDLSYKCDPIIVNGGWYIDCQSYLCVYFGMACVFTFDVYLNVNIRWDKSNEGSMAISFVLETDESAEMDPPMCQLNFHARAETQ